MDISTKVMMSSRDFWHIQCANDVIGVALQRSWLLHVHIVYSGASSNGANYRVHHQYLGMNRQPQDGHCSCCHCLQFFALSYDVCRRAVYQKTAGNHHDHMPLFYAANFYRGDILAMVLML